jgi:transposase
MKNYEIKPFDGAPQRTIIERMPSLIRRLSVLERLHPEHAARASVCIGADLEKAGACLAIQVGAEGVIAHITLSRADVKLLCKEFIGRGWRVALGVEACGFGWLFQAQLREAGAEVFTFATEALTGKRKTNQRDAAALARLVAGRVVHGDDESGRTVREPSPQEQQRRFLTRHRAQLVGHRGRIEGQGRGLIYDSGIEAAPECWWGKKKWPRFAEMLTQSGQIWLRDVLEKQQEHAQFVHAQILECDEQIAALSTEETTRNQPHGLGDLTTAMLDGEVMDWNRFKNRKQAGSYVGCSPSEHSTGEGQVLGNIDRQGNRRIRSALVEAIWRMLRWNPTWRGFAKHGDILRDKKGSSVRKKKACIACVRLLFIDLWRLKTGRTTLEAIGLKPKPVRPEATLATDEENRAA